MKKCYSNSETQVLNTTILDNIKSHPCYSKSASFKYGRIHLPVAKHCNVQCNYCNRKYNCVNENRPGITSKILSPQEALSVVTRLITENHHISVVGVAGPGDSLANPEETFETIKLIHDKYPKLHYCISTNGLTLLDNIDQILSAGIRFVTVTVNAVDAKIAALIYEYININGEFIKGDGAASILISRQLQGIRQLSKHNVNVKVNMVCIPNLNWDHLNETAKAVKDYGAVIVNPIPFIPIPNTNLQNHDSPTPDQMKRKKYELSQIINVMAHCHRCRSDAFGLLNENKTIVDFCNVDQ